MDRGIDEDARPVKVRLDAGQRQETGKLDVGNRRRLVAYPLETGVAGIAARATDHDEASPRQTLRQF